MSKAQVDNFVRKMQALKNDSQKLRDRSQEIQEEVIDFCNGDQIQGSLMMALISDVCNGKTDSNDVLIDVAADGTVTIGRVARPKPVDQNEEVKTDAE